VCALWHFPLQMITSPKPTKSRNPDFVVFRGSNSNWDFGLIWIGTEEDEFLDLVDFGGTAFWMESVVLCATHDSWSEGSSSERWSSEYEGWLGITCDSLYDIMCHSLYDIMCDSLYQGSKLYVTLYIRDRNYMWLFMSGIQIICDSLYQGSKLYVTLYIRDRNYMWLFISGISHTHLMSLMTWSCHTIPMTH